MRLGFIAALSLLVSPAVADTLCRFTTECLEGEACAETVLTATRGQTDDTVVTWDTEAEALSGHMIASDDNFHFVFEAPSAAHLLTEYADGSARYTVHMDGPFTITYHGTCEDKP